MTDKSHLDEILGRITAAYFQGQEDQPLTEASIEAEKWNAVYRPLPANASPELANAADRAAGQCVTECIQAMQDARLPGPGFKTNEQWVEQTGDAIDPAAHFETHLRAALGAFGVEGPEPVREQQAMRSDNFRAAAEATTQTPQDQRERDLADVTKQLAQTAGVLETPGHAAFLRDQNERGAVISRTAAPEQRQELRNEREAVAHEYAGQLADRIAGAAGLGGQRETSDDLKRFAETQREIAAAIREPEQTPPGKSREEIRQEFSADAAEVGRNIGLGQSARTIHIDERGPTRPQDAEPPLFSPSEPQRPEPTLTRGVTVGIGPGGATLVEINQDRPDVRGVAEPPHDERAAKNEAELLTHQAAESTKRQESEQDAMAGRDSTDGKAVDPVRQATLAALREHKESMGDRDGGNDGPTRPTDHAPAFRSFGR